MSSSKKKFKYVDFLWDDKTAKKFKNNEVDLLLYRSNLLGADLRITNYGGGNTSCRTIEKDPTNDRASEVMWIKGSGGDIGSLKKDGLASLYVEKLKNLKKVYKGIDHEDEMVNLFNYCIFDLTSKAPSIDTPLHGLLPFNHIDHLHPDAIISIAACKDGKKICKAIWGNTMGWIPWQRPGFDLALKLEDYLAENPSIRGLILESHGLFTWGDTAYDCYINSLEVIEMASEYVNSKIGSEDTVFGGQVIKVLSEKKRHNQASLLAPLLRGLCSNTITKIGHFTDDKRVLQFINSNDLKKLAPLGTSCPDHFLRTKIKPLVLNFKPDEDLSDINNVLKKLTSSFEIYRKEYAKYYNTYKKEDSPTIRDTDPVVIIYPGVGMFTFAKNKQTARVASEFYINAINVMKGAEAISTYIPLSRKEAFNIEYWNLEEAKFKRMPPAKPLSGKIALITGASGGIGKAVVEKFVKEGANVVLTDLNEKALNEIITNFDKDQAVSFVCDVTSEQSVKKAIKGVCLDFGGVDIIVHSAGLAISKPIEETTNNDWQLLQDVLVKGQFFIIKKAVTIMRKQNLGGNIVTIASKNGLVSGPNNVAYGTAKAAQQHMTRLLAAELGKDNIRVNTINPDGVIIGSKIWEGEWAEGRAKSNGITVEELPEFYAQRNLLHQIILPQDIANGVFALVSILDKSTGNTLNIDGGMPNAFVR